MAAPLLIIRETRTGVDAWLVEGRGKSRTLRALAHVAYEDSGAAGDAQTRFDVAVASVVQAIDPVADPTVDPAIDPEMNPDIKGTRKDNTIQVMLLLPTAQFCFRHTRLPFTSRSKIRQILPLELESRFSGEPGPVVTGFFAYKLESALPGHSADDSRGAGASTVSTAPTPLVFSGSIEEKTLASYHTSLVAAGLAPVVIVPGALALAIAHQVQYKRAENFVFLDFDGADTVLVLVARTHVIQVRTLAGETSPQAITRAIRQMLLGFWQQFGLMAPFQIHICEKDDDTAARSRLETALADVFRFQSDYIGQGNGQGPRGASMDEPDSGDGPDFMNEPVFVDFFRTLASISPDLDMLNICPGTCGSDSFIRAWAGYIISCCTLALLAFILFMVNIHQDISRLEHRLDRQNQAVAAIYTTAFPDRKTGGIDPFLLMQADVGALTRGGGTATGGSDDAGRVQAGHALSELSRCIPAAVDIQVERLMLDRERMILSGFADNYNTIDKVKGFIEASPFFRQVNISSAVAGKGGKRVDFKFIVEM